MEQQNQIEWRRDKVQELCSKGYSQREISQVLQVGLATVNRDRSYLMVVLYYAANKQHVLMSEVLL
jgi:Trp operon repressor